MADEKKSTHGFAQDGFTTAQIREGLSVEYLQKSFSTAALKQSLQAEAQTPPPPTPEQSKKD